MASLGSRRLSNASLVASRRSPSPNPNVSQLKKSGKHLRLAYFKEVITEAGVTLRYDDLPNYINQEQALVARDIIKKLKSHIAYPTNNIEFLTGLKLLCEKEVYYQKSLLPCELRKSDVTSSEPPIQQWSLMKILLCVPPIQNEIVEMLLTRATLIVANTEDDPSKLRLLLNPLRYLSHISDTNTLATKVLDLLEIASFPMKNEVLNLIPEIMPDCESEKTAKQLIKLLQDNLELSGAIVDCLNTLNLNADLINEIQLQIISLLNSTDVTKMFPILFEFLVSNSKNLQEVLVTCRSTLADIFESDNDDYKVLIFSHLHTIAYKQKSVYEGWLVVLSNIRLVVEFRAVDLLLLFILYSVSTPRKSVIDALIRKRIKSSSMKVTILEKLSKCMVPQILKDCLEAILQIADGLLKYNDDIFTDFASETYRMLFTHSLIDRLERHDIVYSLLKQIGSDKKCGSSVLKILLSLLKDDYMHLRQHSVQLMGLIEKLDCVDLKDVVNIFEILCSLTCGERADESMSGLGDELHIIIRKYLNSAKKVTKFRGIIGAVAMVRALVTTEKEQKETTLQDTILISSFNDDNAKTAASLLQTINTYTTGTTDALGLYYDQLAAMLTTSTNLNDQFLVWLYQIVTNDFQTIYITENSPGNINDVKVTLQYSLNKKEDVETQIAVNIAELTLNPGTNSILTLAPHLRLLQLVHFQQHRGDLESIDALLGCGIILPVLDDFDNYDTLQLKQVADCIFHCINWFRELISAFVKQKSRTLRRKVLERITGVMELEELLKKCLSNIPEHHLPQSYFDHISQTSSKRQLSPSKSKPTRPRKKAKTAETVTQSIDDTIASTSAPVTQAKTTTKKIKPVKNVKFEFREIDIDVVLLFRYPLKFDALDISVASQLTSLNVDQLKFLMEEFVIKLSGGSKNLNFTNLIKDCAQLIPTIQKHLNAITLNLDEMLKEADGCLDAKQLFTTEANNLKLIITLVMQAYSLIFGWSGFQNTKNISLLRECLGAFRSVEHQTQIISVKALVADATGKFLAHIDHCIYLQSAVYLIKIIQALHAIQPLPEMKKKITFVSGRLLKKNWYNLDGELESGKNAHLNIDILIKAYLSGANVRIISGLVGTLRDEVSKLSNKEDKLTMLCSIDKTNFYLFYRGLCVNLLEAIRTEVITLTNNQHLDVWRSVAVTMLGLMNIVKAQETKTNLISFLKNSVGVLKVFLTSGIPILEIMLRSKPDEVVEIFKIMQTSTRFLHSLCCYSKYTKNTGLVAFVPQFRLTLESLIYRVKAALVANGCAAAFWMGNLRNKDLHGEDILSQSTVQSDETQDAEEELPPDDTDDDSAAKNPSEDEEALNESDTSASEIF